MENDRDIFEIHSDFCSILANSKRLRIMWLLDEEEKSVSEISEALDIPYTNVSQHLRVMKNHGAVISTKHGHQVYYRISNKKFIKGCKIIREGLVETFAAKSKILAGD